MAESSGPLLVFSITAVAESLNLTEKLIQVSGLVRQ